MLTTRNLIAVVSLTLLALVTVDAQEPYRRPPAPIDRMLEAPPSPSVSVDPSGEWMILVHRESLPPISELVKPMWRLGGMRLNPATNGRHGASTTTGLSVQSLAGGAATRLVLPQDAIPGFPSWSPDGRHFAFTMTRENGIQAWIGDTEKGSVRPLIESPLNGAGGRALHWLDNDRLLCRFIPEGRGAAPEAARIPIGPVIQETSGRTAAVRTYQDLLQNPYDERRLDWIMTTQLGVVEIANGRRRNVGAPALYSSIDPSPNGRYWLVTRIERPYSYLVPVYRFPRTIEVWNERGQVVHTVARKPLEDAIPLGGVATGPRSVTWQDTRGDRLVWVEALDGGNPKAEVPHRDRVMVLDGFEGEPRELLKTEHRFSGARWIENSNVALVREYDRDRRWSRSWLVDFGQWEPKPRLVWDLSSQDRYADPGRPVTRIAPNGRQVIQTAAGSIYLTGAGASPLGDRPFLDRMNLETLKTERLWRCRGEMYESVVRVLSADGNRILTRHESKTEPPNYYVRNRETGVRGRLTAFEDPQPELRGIRSELVTYKRDDGVQLSAKLYLPVGYEERERLPLIVWAYPREFNSSRTAGQVRGSPYRFTSVSGSSHRFLLTQGYAIMDGAGMPVIGDPETANDSFVEQIVSSAKAAIDKAVAMGIADRNRVGVGGHSYGAFMTANLLAHSNLFKAGIARSGAYNRSLTPFGFQNERRTFWEAPEVYFAMSPFMHANKIDEPILMTHGERDNNSGTFPLQSKRLYHAIKGHGGTARLVMLPFESHGYRSRESVMHVVAEMVEWFDRYVKGERREIF